MTNRPETLSDTHSRTRSSCYSLELDLSQADQCDYWIQDCFVMQRCDQPCTAVTLQMSRCSSSLLIGWNCSKSGALVAYWYGGTWGVLENCGDLSPRKSTKIQRNSSYFIASSTAWSRQVAQIGNSNYLLLIGWNCCQAFIFGRPSSWCPHHEGAAPPLLGGWGVWSIVP